MLVESEGLVRGSLLDLHFAQFCQGIDIVFVEFDRLAQGAFGAAQVFLRVEKRGPQQIVKVAIGGCLGDGNIGGGGGLIRLLLSDVGVHEAAQALGGRWILIQCLLEELLGIGEVLLSKLNVA